MADTVTSALLENGNRNWAYSFTNASDGTGEAGVVKVDGSATGPLGVTIAGNTLYPLSHIKMVDIEYDIKGMQVEIIWDATTQTNALILGGFGRLKFWRQGGLAAVAADGTVLPGATGKIKFTTLGAGAGSSYWITIWGKKGIHQ